MNPPQGPDLLKKTHITNKPLKENNKPIKKIYNINRVIRKYNKLIKKDT